MRFIDFKKDNQISFIIIFETRWNLYNYNIDNI